MSRKRKDPVVDRDNPEWTKADFARAVKFPKGATLAEATAAVRRRGRPPQATPPKEPVSLRLDADVLAAYRATGEGWQTRINADLRKARRLKAG